LGQSRDFLIWREVLNYAKTIAIDGPVASGKSSVGLSLANRLGYLFLDTGVMYRAATWAVLNSGLKPSDENAISDLVKEVQIKIKESSDPEKRANDILINEVNISEAIKEKCVNDHVSQVSAFFRVREVLTEQQRKFGEKGRVVMVGRDIGTVVLPDAELKVFLKASIEERARRRFEEEKFNGKPADYQEILENMRKRDSTDSTRKHAPLKAAKDAIIIQTDGKTRDQVVEEILKLSEKGG